MREDEDIATEMEALIKSTTGEPPYIGGRVPEDRIASAERALHLKFPSTYRLFVERFGAGFVLGFEIHGLSDDSVLKPDVIDVNRLPHRSLPNHYLRFTDDGGDYAFYFDTSKTDEAGDCPVVVFGPGADGIQVATNFLDFLRRLSRGEELF